MPVRNAGRFLVESIESILNQTVSDFEFLIIDDASTDNSWKIIQKYAKKDRRIIIFRNKVKSKLVKSLNFLNPKTKGKYIARMDADDISLPDRFEKQVEYLEKNPNIVACGGQEYIIDEEGKTVAEKYFPSDPKACHDLILNYMVVQPPALMARGNDFRRYRYQNHIFGNDDISMHFKLLQSGDFGNVGDFIFKYRKSSHSLTHDNPKKVYFLALKVRIYAILFWNYQPALLNSILTVFETLLVAILPNRFITPMFEMIRFKDVFAKKIYGSGFYAQTVRLAKAMNML